MDGVTQESHNNIMMEEDIKTKLHIEDNRLTKLEVVSKPNSIITGQKRLRQSRSHPYFLN